MAFENNQAGCTGEILMKFEGTDEVVGVKEFDINIETEVKELTEAMKSMTENKTSQKESEFIENDTLTMMGD